MNQRLHLIALFSMLIVLLSSETHSQWLQTNRLGDASGPAVTGSNAFDLDIGNRWFYRAGSRGSWGKLFGIKAQIIDTLQNGIRVVKIDSLYLDRRGRSTAYWYDDGQGRLYLPISASEPTYDYPLYDASLKADTARGYVTTPYSWYYQYRLIDSTILGLATPAQKVWRREFSKVDAVSEDYVTAPGLAFVAARRSGSGLSSSLLDSMELVGLVRKGVVLGDTTLTADSLRVAHTPSPLTSTITATPTTVPANGFTPSYITLQAKDFFGHPLTTGGDDVHIYVFGTSGSPWTALSDLRDNNDGTYTCALVASPMNPGTATLAGAIGSNWTVSKCTVTLVDQSPVSPTNSTISANPQVQASNGTSISTITVQLKDPAGNKLTMSGGTVSLKTTLGSLGYVKDNYDGTYTATLTSPTDPGTAMITGSVTSSIKSYSGEIGATANVYFALSTYSLQQNYPNPFNSATSITYVLPVASNVELSVFNVLGEKVRDLVRGEVDAGAHDVRFDASDLGSGVYMYRLSAGSYVETKKLCLIK